ncbi:MAG: pilus assembly protein PilM [Chitinispirillales bacterium]|jgi:Tfp pilus assembly PilM family ATPase|nr:pilus assembly protein PilM [Chitinispirillales bacterium]
MSKKQTFVGFDQDNSSIRAARLLLEPGKGKGARPRWRLLSAEEVMGDFYEDVKLIAGLKRIKSKLGVHASDKISTCLSGKQTYAIQMDVRKLPDAEMAGMLKLELRKSMPFEASVATFDYQFLPVGPNQPVDQGVPVVVAAAANSYIAKHIQSYDRAGLKPHHVDILPTSIANAFWVTRKEVVPSDETHVILHIAPNVCTLIIDGHRCPFFNRTFAFSIGEVISSAAPAGTADEISQDVILQMNILASEITKSITYYKNTYSCGNVSTITVLGLHSAHSAFDALGKKMGYDVQTIQTAQLVHAVRPPRAGKYDLAIGLAMQASGANV